MKWWWLARDKWKSSALVRGTSVFLVGNLVVNFGSFAYHVIMARLLGPIDYGILGSLLGLTYVLTIPTGGLDLLVVKVVSGFKTEQRLGQVKSFVIYLSRKLVPWLVALAVVLIVGTLPVANFLHLDSWHGVALVWIGVYLAVVSTIGLAVLRGLLHFGQIVVNQIISIALKVVLSATLVMGGISSYLGAQIGTVISMAVALGVLFVQVGPVLRSKSVAIKTADLRLRSQGLVTLLFSAAFVSMYSLDVVLVRHFLPQFEAGIYASLVTAGKIVFFALAPVAVVLLPVVARKVNNPSQARGDLLTATGIALVGGLVIVATYFVIPEVIVNALFTSKFGQGVVFLPWLGLAMWGYSLANIFGSFLLALNHTKVIVWATGGLVFELISITLFHASLWQVIWGLTAVFWALAVVLYVLCLKAVMPRQA